MESEETDHVENNGVADPQEPTDDVSETNESEPVTKTRASTRPKRNCTVESPTNQKKKGRGRGRGKKIPAAADNEVLKNDEQKSIDNGESQKESNAGEEPYDPHEVDDQFSDAAEPENKEEEQTTPEMKSEKVEDSVKSAATDEEEEDKTTLENMIVIDECKPSADAVKAEEEPDTEMVSEDELSEDKSMENVSDDELPATAQPLPETEDLSEDELTVDKKKKVISDSPTPDIKKTSPKETTSDNQIDKKSSSSVSSTSDRKRKKTDSSDSSSKGTKLDESASKKSKSAVDTSKSSSFKKYVPELEKYWKAVREDPTDFTGWTYLLQYVDMESNVEHAREAYDAFLARYPYCYGYWRKYADFEKRKGSREHCEQVFVSGLSAIPLSVDLWLHYLNYFRTTYPEDEVGIRSLYDKAIQACGLEFRSDRLWESYIKWETDKKKLVNVTAIFDKLLATPTQNYLTHFEKFQDHVMKHSPRKILSVDDFLNLRREVLQILKQYDSPLIGVPGGDDAPPGEEEPSDEKEIKHTNEETAALRDKIIAMRRKVHKATAEAVTQRLKYEDGIKRPYFHVKPLERCQLENWRSYLEFEIAQGDMERIIILFERCLIACALYEEFWLKFILFLEKQGDEYRSNLENTFKRACTIHHVKKPNLHLHWAIFEETQGNFEKAAEILSNLERNFPSLAQVAFRRINLERRRKAYPKVCELYEHYISSSAYSKMANNMVVKYARFCAKVLLDIDKGIKVLEKAMEKDKDCPRLYFQIIDLCMQRTPLNVNEVVSYLDKFLSKDNAEAEQKVMIAQHKVEFLEDFASDASAVQKAHNEYLQYVKIVKDNRKKAEEAKLKTEAKSLEPPPTSSFSSSSSSSSSKHSTSKSAPNSAPPLPQAMPPAPGPYGHSNHAPPYGAPPMGPYAGGQYPAHPPAPGPYGQGSFNPPYNQGDPNFSNYQNWGYSQPGYGAYPNQGWANTGGGGGGGGGPGFNY
nr:PREDICTED: pre-mRNA-processing factor 39-like [Bemisia tabaci]